MRKTIKLNQHGLAHVAVALLVVVVLGVVGFAGWRVMNKDKTSNSGSNSEAVKQAAAECKKELDDKDLCKFLTAWDGLKQFSITSSDTVQGKTSTSVIKIDNDKTHLKTEGEYAYEVISIGNNSYTKAGDTWWKQTTQPSPENEAVSPSDYKFEEPDTASGPNQTKYEKQGKEACGNLQCFKYKVVDPTSADQTQYVWFDDQDYLTRRTRIESANGNISEQTYAYDDVSVTEPSPVKDLAPNQYILPGQNEPTTLPDAADLL